MIELICARCKIVFKRKKCLLARDDRVGQKTYCTRICADTAKAKISRICRGCSTQYNHKHSYQLFCTLSCSVKFNNKQRINIQKSKATILCKCGKKSNKGICKSCYLPDWTKITVNDLGPGYSSKIRSNARVIYATSGRPTTCFVCGHHRTQVCHIKPVKNFSKDTPISNINAIDNLVALCPNHHDEFDNGLINIGVCELSQCQSQ